MIAELIGTYFIIFAGCGAVAVDKIYGKVTFPGVCVTWGLIVMVMIYSLAHISGAHFNPAVTIALAIFRQFKWRQVSAVLINSFKENVVVKQLTCDWNWKCFVGSIVHCGSGGGIALSERYIEFNAWCNTTGLFWNRACWIQCPVFCCRNHHLLPLDVCHLRRRHRWQSREYTSLFSYLAF